MKWTTYTKWKWPAIVLIIALILAISLILIKSRPNAVPLPETAWRVSAQTVNKVTVKPEVTLYGTVESPRDTTIKAEIESEVIATPIKEGNAFSLNETLITLSDEEVKLKVIEFEAEVNALEARIAAEKTRYQADQESLKHEQELVELSRNAYDRQKNLKESKHASQAELDNAKTALAQQLLNLTQRQLAINDHKNRLKLLQAQLQKAKAGLQQANIDLADSIIKAPYAGRMATLDIAVGDHVRPGDKLALIYDIDALEVRAQIPDRYIPTIRWAFKHNVPLEASGIVDGETVKFRLQRLAALVSARNSGIDGLFLATENKAALTLGRTVELILYLPEVKDAIIIPNQSLYGLNQVYKISNERLQRLVVTRVGNYQEDKLLITSDELNPGDLLLISQLPNAMSGLKVDVKVTRD